ncbi:hypothetical protein C8N40_102183 [Pontibacter mucosus]|uniref:Uncharacterized protein n=1 Tax=Pontibacter mucosus TaxID=1649266 RepID=A0A2T5YPH5_9BACT|nr:hypothetical protein C8N40_102183 [Pontibacter mucosus]
MGILGRLQQCSRSFFGGAQLNSLNAVKYVIAAGKQPQ